jgi:hypothetical protein
MGLLPEPPASVDAGTIDFEGRDLLTFSAEERRRVRGRRMAMVFQEPSRFLNPAFRIGEQLGEVLRLHEGMDRAAEVRRATELVDLVGLRGGRRVSPLTPTSYRQDEAAGDDSHGHLLQPVASHRRRPTTALNVTLRRRSWRSSCPSPGLPDGVLFIRKPEARAGHRGQVSVMYAGRVVVGPRESCAGRCYAATLQSSVRELRSGCA